jgi:hypothetical protein
MKVQNFKEVYNTPDWGVYMDWGVYIMCQQCRSEFMYKYLHTYKFINNDLLKEFHRSSSDKYWSSVLGLYFIHICEMYIPNLVRKLRKLFGPSGVL